MKTDRSRNLVRLSVDRLEDRVNPIVWPVGIWHSIYNSFGAMSVGSTFGFHEGIDIRADGEGGQSIVAARAGKVVYVHPTWSGGAVIIDVDGIDEWDTYFHIDIIKDKTGGLGLAKNDVVKVADPLGTISKVAGYPRAYAPSTRDGGGVCG